MALDGDSQQVLIRGLPRVKGKANHALIAALLANYNADLHAGRAPERFRYTASRKLASELSIDEQTLRRRVSRLRPIRRVFSKFLKTEQRKFTNEAALWGFVAGADRFLTRIADLSD